MNNLDYERNYRKIMRFMHNPEMVLKTPSASVIQVGGKGHFVFLDEAVICRHIATCIGNHSIDAAQSLASQFLRCAWDESTLNRRKSIVRAFSLDDDGELQNDSGSGGLSC
jgi:hypothetical protein